jgi:hypothetical protein
MVKLFHKYREDEGQGTSPITVKMALNKERIKTWKPSPDIEAVL